ncbi:surface antigen BspA-like [Trichomonas vaginalis G3]|uniref:Surface antigen BspA-like n=1 Tax=Trichomonas vaginalis (strain ATCC PRA-98 / G3) TaxID=412133 RepID=A2DZY1_TRIV3|nr:ribonuclease inhibitor domain-containing protein [Trichomonas vaginalis G3]EAY14040.1 surface antigen BspA-like [Trichomonas vaginalis G3]KAI5519518.1 ribonuclease inhibitor domain-containing protein [Trichomonas vaginalis G3]|eukprot:XP_001326263.1 surface antigen BspA-like [Trichomonas vaginalis G3]
MILNDAETSIGSYAFANSTIISITGSNIASISPYAFYKCSELQTIDLSKARQIGIYAFTESGLTEANVNSIESLTYSFYKCEQLTTITLPDSIAVDRELDMTGISTITFSNIGEKFFMPSLTELTFTGDMFQIQTNQPSLETIIFTNPNIYSVSITNQFSMQKVVFPASINGELSASFQKCVKLTTVENSNLITSLIQYMPFASCVSLETIDLSGVHEFNDEDFLNCYKLKTIIGFNDDGEHTTPYTLYGRLFRNCWNFKISSITEGKYTFDGYSPVNTFAWTGIEELTLGYWESGGFYFFGCKNLKTVDMSSITNLDTIPKYMFRDCISLTQVKLPSSVTSIRDYAFENTKILIYEKRRFDILSNLLKK